MRLSSSEGLLLSGLVLLTVPAHAGGEPCTPQAVALGMCTEDGKQRYGISDEDMELVRRLAADAEKKEQKEKEQEEEKAAPRPLPPPAPLRGIRVDLPGDEAEPSALDGLSLEDKPTPAATGGVGELELRRKAPAARHGTRPTAELPTIDEPAPTTARPVPVPQPERTWAGWADETASAVWIALFGE